MKRLLFAIVVALTLFGLTAPVATPAMAATTTLNPNASGSSTQLYRGAGTSNWNACSSSDGDTSFVGWGDTSWSRYDLYNLADPVSPSGTINSVTVYFEARAVPTPTQPSAQTVVRIGSTNYYGGTSTTRGGGTTYTLTKSYATYSYTYSTKPGGGSWSWSDINGLQAGIALRSASGVYGQSYESRCTRVWVVVDYTSGNNPPVAAAKTVSTNEDIALGITLSGSDVETVELTFSIVTPPAHGTLSSISNNPGTTGSPNTDTASVTYTPAADYSGSDSFTFKASDGVADSNIATVSITVNSTTSTISVNDFANYRVFQRDISGTSKSVPISGTYSNMDWNRVEARIVQHGTNTAVVGWTTIDTTPGGGTFSGNLIVPQGGWYNIETRALGGAGSVIGSSRGANKWGVGMIILCIGQSNMSGHGQPPFTVATSDLAVNYSNAGIWEHLADPYDDDSPAGAVDNDNSTAAGSMIPALANSLLQTFNFPIAFVPSPKDGTNLYSQWVYRNPSNHYDTATLYGQSITKAQSVGGVELIIMHQGEADTNDHRTEAQYEADFATMIGNYRQDLYATIPIFICQLGTIQLGTNTRTDADVQAVRNAQHDLDNGVNIFMAATAMDQPRLDAVHYTCQGLNAIGGRIAQTIKYYFGVTSYYRGPAITSAFFVGNRNTVEIQIVHRGGNDITPVSGITGFSLLSDGSPVGITSVERISVDRIRLTLASVIPQNATVKLRYLWGSNPDTSAIIKDNSSLALPLENITTDITVTAANNPPVANNQAVGTAEGAPVAITLSATDADGDTLTYSIVTPPSHGTLSGTSPNVTYTPNSGYNGSDSFTFKANDGVADSNIATVSITVTTAAITFTAAELLGRPTDNSITVNVVPNGNGEVYFKYGTASGVYPAQTSPATLTSGTPTEVVIGGLTPNTRYYYRMVYRQTGTTDWIERDEHSFYTQRSPASTFTFTIISDSHMNGGGGNVALYEQTLDNVGNDNPDFHLDLGDTFWMDGVTSATVANQRYLAQRSWMGAISHSVPIFVATGNHENEEGWNFDDANSKALLSVNARKLYYPNPIPDSFYTGNTDNSLTAISGDHLREDYYAWEWGDALFVVIDPYQYTLTKPYAGSPGGEDNDEAVIGDRWDWTLGQQQFNWFKQTLETSDATFKFVFAHHMLGGSQDYVRGGAEPAHMFEWGGYNADGTTWGFNTERPGWGDDPIHQLMIDNGVSAFFHGHDHEYAYEERDGIVYQLVPAPSMTGYGFGLYSESDPYTIRVLPNPGHLRVTVSPTQATVDYVGTSTGTVAYSYTIMAGSGNKPPVANAQSVTTNEDTAKAVTLTATDADGDTLTYSIVASPTRGTLSGTPPNVTYAPVANYNGSDSFTFKANDGQADSNTVTVSITISVVNDAPGQPTLVAPPSGGVDIGTAPALEVAVSDPDADPLDVTFYGREVGTGTGEDFTIIALPDTQNEAQSYPAVFMSQTQWMVDNEAAGNIVFVTHVGDIVNTASSATQWQNADAAMDLLDSPGIPYSVGPGNHDIGSGSLYETYFGILRFSGKSWYGGYYSGDNYNNYSLFSVEGMNFILINLQYNSTTAMLNWADALLKANPTRRGIVVQHDILNINNSWQNQAPYTALKDNPNLFLMLCGHMHSSSDGAAYRAELGDDGHTIHIMLADYQDYPNGGNGYLRILRFSPADDKIYATTYSPYTGTSITSSPDQMEMVYDMAGSAAFEVIGTDNGVASGNNASITWPSLASGTTYEWYVAVSDGSQTTAGSVWSFATGGSTNNPPVANAQSVATDEDTAKAVTLTATDADGDTLTYSIVTPPAHGSLTGTAPNVTYTPAANYNGSDSFTFKANDGIADSNEATVSITVTAVNNPPAAPSNLSAAAISTTQINLSWQDNSGDETGFRIERKTGASGAYAQIATTGTNVTTYSDSGLSPSTTYYYRVRAYNANGDASYSNEASATTQSPPSNNLALNKPATADSEQTSGGNTANKGNDGNSSTRWSANDGRWNRWWKVDLGNTYTLTGTKVQFQFARNYRYKIEVSTDNISWTIVADRTATTSAAQTREDSFSATPGRYVRITYTFLPLGFPPILASHYEFEVYGN